MGLGAYLGYDSEDIKEIVNDLISNGLVDIYSNTSSTDAQYMYDTKKYKAPAKEYNADNIFSSTVLCSYDEFMTWYDNLSDEEQWKVDDIADTNGIPFYEEASDDELAWLQDVATIEIHASADTVEASYDGKVFIEDIIDGLEDNGYDLSRIRSIRQGLLELFGYKGRDADIIIHGLVAGGFIEPNDWVDKDYTPGVYSATEENYMDHNKFVKLLKDKFDFSLEAANIVAQWYENENALDDFDSIQSLLEYIEDDIYDMLDAATDAEEYEIVSKYIYDDDEY